MPKRLPESAQQVVIAGQRIAYTLRRSTRRTIGLQIDQRGLRVGAPLRATLRDIESLLHSHGQWIVDRLTDWRERPAATPLPVTDGQSLPLLGRAVTLRLREQSCRPGWQLQADELQLGLSRTVDPPQQLEQALRAIARQHFTERLAVHAARLGVGTPPLRLSSARTRWGSCNARGGIALNWRLVFLPPEIIDYVVCHELAHLREMNHSPRFWAVVGELCPDWRNHRLTLRQLGRQIPHF